MHVSGQDLRLAFRTLRKHRGFTAVAVLSLALAIALNTTMYSVMDALVKPPVAMNDPDRLYTIEFYGDYGHRLPRGAVEDALRSGLHGYEAITGARPLGFVGSMIEHGGRFHDGRVLSVRPDYFTVLGVNARKGRLFGPADTSVDTPSAVISERVVAKLFPDGANPVGQSIKIDGQAYGVVGVLARGADFCRSCVMAWVLPRPDQMRGLPLNLMRIRPSTAMPVLDGELAVLASRLALATGDGPGGARFRVVPAVHGQFEFRRFHYALIAAVLAVLLVACFNLANMQVARGIGRARELAVRVALGASRGLLVRQLLIESAMLAFGGLAVGIFLTAWGAALLTASVPQTVGAYIVEPQFSWRVVVFAIATTVTCLVIVGLVPAVRVTRVNPNALLKSGAGTGAHRPNQRRYGVLVVGQIGLALALLSGAAIVVRQAWRIEQVRFGFDPRPLAVAQRYFERPRDGAATFLASANQLLAHTRGLPDVADVAAYAQGAPDGHAITVTDPGRTVEIPAGGWGYRVVSPSYLRTFNLPIVSGRDFHEGEQDVPAVIVDRKTALFLWPNSDPIGSMIKLGEFKSRRPWMRVVGVVGEESDLSTVDRSLKPALSSTKLGQVYVLGTTADTLWGGSKTIAIMNLVARARAAPERLPVTLRRALGGLPGTIGLQTSSMEASRGYATRRENHDFVAALFMAFATLAVALAALGIYGIVSHSVAERRREIGVRIALGASSRGILTAVLREGNVFALCGIALGLALTKLTAGWLQAFSMEDDQYDALLFAGMAVVLFVITVIAALVPAFRATRVDPVEALRSE